MKNVMEYNRYLLDQAEDDVDRLIITEGNITWNQRKVNKRHNIIDILAITPRGTSRMYERGRSS